MEWMVYLLGALGFGAVVLAIYERKNNIKIREDAAAPPNQTAQNAYLQATQTSIEGAIWQRHVDGSGGDGTS